MAKRKEEDYLDEFEDDAEEEQFPETYYYQDDYDNFDDLGDSYDDLAGNIPMEKHSDLLKELTNFAPYLKETVNGWLGLTWNETEGKYMPNKHIQPIMNRHCAAWCVSFLKIYARGNNIITDVNNSHFNNIMSDIIENVWYNVGTRADLDFGIKEDGDILRVCNELEHAAQLVLMGAGDGRYNKFLAGTMQTNYRGDAMGGQPQDPYGRFAYSNNIPQNQQKGTALQRMKQVFLGS